jgi:hypothetical protein
MISQRTRELSLPACASTASALTIISQAQAHLRCSARTCYGAGLLPAGSGNGVTQTFAIVAMVQIFMPGHLPSPRMQAARVWNSNGYYINRQFSIVSAGKTTPAKP